jgi:amino acid adenylation domain-containing protein
MIMSAALAGPSGARTLRIDPADPMVALGRGPAIAYRHRPVHELIEDQVQAGRDRVAVECAGTALSYADLWLAATRVRDALLRAGLRPGAPVGVALERARPLVPALLGIWRAGGGYVPLDEQMPARRRERIVDEAGRHGMSWLLTDHPAKAAALGASPVHEIGLPQWRRPVLACRLVAARSGPGREPGIADLAYVMYTSGSTGQPKGTVITHRNACAFLKAIDAALGADDEEVAIATTPLTFDISVLELFWPLSAGRRVILLDSYGNAEPGVLGAVLRRPGPKLLQVTPSTAALVDFPADEHELRLLVGGEALPRQTAARLLSRCGRLVNLYGPTETTVWVTQHQVREPGDSAVVPLGRPLPNCGLVVLGADGRPVPLGAEGELYVYGPQVARGYLSAGAASSDAFLRDAGSGQRAYRTGDRAAWSADGTLRFLGRVDNQVKIAGNRVELGEVEAALRAYAGVRDAAVILDLKVSPPRVRAFIELESPAGPPPAGIWSHLAQRLPAHMLPVSLRLLSRLPLTSSGKVDRAALAAGAADGAGIAVEQAARQHAGVTAGTSPGPAADLLARLLELARGQLGTGLGPDDDLVRAGVTSLDAVRVAGTAWQRFGWNITAGQILRTGTLRAVADQLARGLKDASGHDHGPAPDIGMSLAQRAMLAQSYLDPGNAKMNMVMRWRLDGTVDQPRLRAALGAVVARHPALRTVYPPAADPVVLDPPGEPDLTVAGPGAGSGAPSASELTRLPFDLEHAPPVRWVLDRSRTASPCLYAVLHHVSADDAALLVLHDALLDAYAGRLSPAAPPAGAYFAACAAERRLLGERRQADRSFWRSRRRSFAETTGFSAGQWRLAGAPARRQAASLPGGAAMMRRTARSLGVTAYSLFLGVASAPVARALGGHCVLAGMPVSSREAVGGEGALGCFANLVPLAIRDHGADMAQTIRSAHSAVLLGLDHGLLPFAEIAWLAELPCDEAGDSAPSFVCQLAPAPQPATAHGVTFTPSVEQPARAFYPVTVRGETSRDDLAVYADYDPGAIDDQFARHLLHEVTTTLTSLSHRYP